MNTGWKIPWTLVLAAALAMLVVPGSAVRAAGGEVVERMYKIDHLMSQDAAMLAHQICLARNPSDRCKYSVAGRQWFSYTADEPTQAKIAEMLGRYDTAPPTLNFRVTLLEAGRTESPEPDLSAGEGAALVDLKKFLPYRGYRLLDAGWVRSSREAKLLLGSNPTYDIQFRFDRNEAADSPSVNIDRFLLYRQGPAKEASEDEGKVTSRQILSTSFSIDVGETVVVGTSRLNGDGAALIVLLTAQN